MLIKYNELDVTHRLLEYKTSVAFAQGYLIGNVPTMQLNLKFDNYDGILSNLDTDIYWEVQETVDSDKRYFRVYDQPEKYTKTLSLKLYDNNYSLDIAYDTKLTYPVTIKDQLDEIGSLTGLNIIRNDIPGYVLNKEVSWYDNTIAVRSYLGWIAELCGANVFAKGIGSLEFMKVSKEIFASTDTLTNFEKNELYKVTRVYAENGLNPLEKGDETGNTMYLDANNLYLDDQFIIDKLYDQFNELTFYSVKSIDMIAIDNLIPGKLVNYNDDFNFMVIDVANRFKGGEYLLSDVDGTVTTKNEERVIKRITNTTRIRKLQIIQDQESLKLDVIAKEQEGLNEKVGQLTISSEVISTSIKEVTNNISKIRFTSHVDDDGLNLSYAYPSTEVRAVIFDYGVDVTDKFLDEEINWIRVSNDPEADEYWNYEYGRARKKIKITRDDLKGKVKFGFEFDTTRYEGLYPDHYTESEEK